MKRFNNLDALQKIIVITNILTIVISFFIYFVNISKEGYYFVDEILVPQENEEGIVYQAKVEGNKISFLVKNDKSVIYSFADETYGPYTIEEDSTAINENITFKDYLIGIVVYEKEKPIFYGSFMKNDDEFMIFDKDGYIASSDYFPIFDNSVEYDEYGNRINPYTPDPCDIIKLTNNPVLKHRGEWNWWFLATIINILNIISVFFIDELFKWRLSFVVKESKNIEPSDYEILTRYLSWIIVPIAAITMLVYGLNVF